MTSKALTLDGRDTPVLPSAAAERRGHGLAIGVIVASKYRLLALLGRGAMGEVWRARHEDLNVDVAIKFAFVKGESEDEVLERFRFEAQVSAQLSQHTAHIVAVHDTGRFDDIPYLVMELVEGVSLSNHLTTSGAIEPERVGTVLTEIGDALETAHRRGIWHRDIKADNIMVAIRPDGRWQLKLTDFGVSKAVAGSRADVSRERETLDVEVPAATMFGHLVGTPAYMSPEQILGAPPDAHSDLWSLAVVAYEALVGRDPFRGDTMDELLSAISVRPHVPPRSLRPELPPAVDAFFAKALAKDPAERYASVAELVAAYHAALLPPPRRGRRIVVAAALLVAVGIIGFALVKTFGWFEPRQQRVNQSVPTVVLNVTASPVPERATAASASVPAPAPAPAPAPRALPLRPLPATPTSAPAPTPNPTPEPHVFDKSEIQ